MVSRVPQSATDDAELRAYVDHVRGMIDRALPPGTVVPQHTADGHFYGVPSGAVYPSVTGKLGAVKDESIQNWAMNEALRHVQENLPSIIGLDGKIDMIRAIDLIEMAKATPRILLKEAGDIGTMIHDRREKYFQDWIDSGALYEDRPDISLYYDRDNDDSRLIAGMLGIERFVTAHRYIPIRTEVMVYSNQFKVAGMLDDIGILDIRNRRRLALIDLKTSNQFKAHYWLQVALYYLMFYENTGIKPSYVGILKVDKNMPKYSIETVKDMNKMMKAARSVLRVYDFMEEIKQMRKNVGKKVIKI